MAADLYDFAAVIIIIIILYHCKESSPNDLIGLAEFAGSVSHSQFPTEWLPDQIFPTNNF